MNILKEGEEIKIPQLHFIVTSADHDRIQVFIPHNTKNFVYKDGEKEYRIELHQEFLYRQSPFVNQPPIPIYYNHDKNDCLGRVDKDGKVIDSTEKGKKWFS